jgi:hypothetical protein
MEVAASFGYLTWAAPLKRTLPIKEKIYLKLFVVIRMDSYNRLLFVVEDGSRKRRKMRISAVQVTPQGKLILSLILRQRSL